MLTGSAARQPANARLSIHQPDNGEPLCLTDFRHSFLSTSRWRVCNFTQSKAKQHTKMPLLVRHAPDRAVGLSTDRCQHWEGRDGGKNQEPRSKEGMREILIQWDEGARGPDLTDERLRLRSCDMLPLAAGRWAVAYHGTVFL